MYFRSSIVMLISILFFLSGCGTVSEVVTSYEDMTRDNNSFGETQSNWRWGSPQAITTINTTEYSEVNPVFDPLDKNVLFFARSGQEASGIPYAFRVYSYDLSTGTISPAANINAWIENIDTNADIRPIGISNNGLNLYLRAPGNITDYNDGVENIYVSSRTAVGQPWQTPAKLNTVDATDNSYAETNIVFKDSITSFMVKTPIAPLIDKYLELKGAIYLSEKITDQWHTQKDIDDEMHVLNGQRNIYSIVFDKLVPNKGFLTCTDASNTNGHDIYEINYDSYNDYWYLGYKIDMNSMSGAGSINSGANDRVFSIANDGKTLALFTNKSDSQKQVYDIYLIDRVYLPQ